jgi:hypothetical protein
MESPVTSGAEALYAERERRFNDVVALRKPDRVPVIPLITHYFPTKIRGISNRDAGYRFDLLYQSMAEAAIEFGWDFAPPTGLLPSAVLDALCIQQVGWPGGALPDDSPFQFVEKEWLAEDEYDAFLADPDGFTVRTMWPRIAGSLAGLGQPTLPLHWLSNSYNLVYIGTRVVGSPPIRRALESLLRAADIAEENDRVLQGYTEKMRSQGYPLVSGAITVPAFDAVSDFFRGLRGGSLDMYRNPDKLLATIELMQPSVIEPTIEAARAIGNPRVFIPMHRGADGFMSEEAFAKFYWPTFKALIEALLAANLVPVPLFEGGYDSRLKYLAELPPGRIAAHFDHVDRRKFKEVCGDVMCFWGNVPASLLCTGTPQEVKDDVKELIDIFGDTGALIIDGNQGIPDEARPENVLAMREAAHEFGAF